MTDLIPTGHCWCGCGAKTSLGAFFAPGHDKTAESAVIKVKYGTVPDFLVENGFGPDGKNPSEELEKFKKRGGEYL